MKYKTNKCQCLPGKFGPSPKSVKAVTLCLQICACMILIMVLHGSALKEEYEEIPTEST